MRAIKYGLAWLWLCVVFAPISYAADEVHLMSGDHLLGSITHISNEYIVIDTAFAKQLKIKHELIAEITTEHEINIVFNDGQQLSAKLVKEDGSTLYYQLDDQSFPLNVTDLTPLDSPSKKPKHNEKKKIKYSASVDVGLSKTSGNEDEEDYHVALMTQARTLKNRYTLEAAKTIEKNDGNKTQDETFASLQYDRFFNDKWYAFTSASFEEDLEELLDLRSTYSLGSGYQFFDQDDITLKAEIGVAYVDEDFEQDQDNHYAGGRWAIDYEHEWLKWLGFYHNHEGFFSLENSDDITIRSSSGLKFPLNEYINAKLEANVDWSRSPAEGATGTDKEYIFTLGYEF